MFALADTNSLHTKHLASTVVGSLGAFGMLHSFPHFLFTTWTGSEQGLEECGSFFDFWPIGLSFGLTVPMWMTALAAETGVMVWWLFADVERVMLACPLLDPFCVPVRLPSWCEGSLLEGKVDRRWQHREGCLPLIG